jgi:hypothetical protein
MICDYRPLFLLPTETLEIVEMMMMMAQEEVV